ncbi:MAG: hypothetical protein ACRECQ_08885 [Burkholderiaceae bacterium]
MLIAKKCCDEFILRVQRDPFFNCSIDLFEHSKQSITELTTEPHSRRAHWLKSVEQPAPEHSGTTGFRGFFSGSPSSPYLNAELFPAFFSRASRSTNARSAEFISVSGQCAARSAHFSDLRNHKRSSGGVAATEHLHAPMNSPMNAASVRLSGFLPNLSTQVH